MAIDANLEKPSCVARRSQRLAISLAVCLSGLLAYFGFDYGPAFGAYLRYAPMEGDIIFQSLPNSPLVDAIEGVTQSPYSHCGIVGKQDARWVVYEALGNVEINPLYRFLFRGREHGFAVYRMRDELTTNIPKTMEALKKYLGRPYDVRYHIHHCRRIHHQAERRPDSA